MTEESTPGDVVRQARTARGLSQERLARLAGVSARTIGRIERGEDYDDPRMLPTVQRALGIGDSQDPPLSKASAIELAGELVRRLSEAERILEHNRLGSGTAPTDLARRPNVITGPQTDEDTDHADG